MCTKYISHLKAQRLANENGAGVRRLEMSSMHRRWWEYEANSESRQISHLEKYYKISSTSLNQFTFTQYYYLPHNITSAPLIDLYQLNSETKTPKSHPDLSSSAALTTLP